MQRRWAIVALMLLLGACADTEPAAPTTTVPATAATTNPTTTTTATTTTTVSYTHLTLPTN